VKGGGGAKAARQAAAEADGDGDGDLETLSRKELDERAKEEGVSGRSKMSKKELVEALKD
jgi:hypothetical protein